MDSDAREIVEKLSNLERSAADSDGHPPVVVVPSEGGAIKGNRAGLIMLALVKLKAADGEDQKFEDIWAVQEELAGTIEGISLDAYAHYDLPKQFTRWERFKSSIILVLFVTLISLLLFVGAETSGRWFWRHLAETRATRAHQN